MSGRALDLKRSNLETLIALAWLLERVERGKATASAERYRVLVQRLGGALAAELPAGALVCVLALLPAAAELYENLQYARAGLCRSPLQASAASEREAREILARLIASSRGALPPA